MYRSTASVSFQTKFECKTTMSYMGSNLDNFVYHRAQTMQILNSDDHANYLRKQNRNPADYRPDIIHQVMSIS